MTILQFLSDLFSLQNAAIIAIASWLANWLAKRVATQHSHALETEIEELKSRLGRENLTHRVHFEKEFKVYEALWATLVELGQATASLRPTVEIVESAESDEERKQRRYGRWASAFNEVLEVCEKNRPFYDESVYKKAQDIIKVSRIEAFQFRRKDPFENWEFYQEAEKHVEEIYQAIEVVCSTIRERVGNVTVIEN